MYQVGDFVVYRQLKVCKIESIETPSFESDKSKRYYRLSPAFENKNETVIYLPYGETDSLRRIAERTAAEKALKALPKAKVAVNTNKKPTQLIAYYQAILTENDVAQHLALLKEVTTKGKGSAKKLSEIDMRYYDKTERLLCEELALALQTTPEEIKTRIHAALQE